MKLTGALLSLVGLTSGFVPKQQNVPSMALFADRQPFITGNWKLNPQTKDEAVTLAQGIADSVNSGSPCDVGLFVPFPFLESVKKVVGDKISVGAEVSPPTLFCNGKQEYIKSF